MTLLELKTQVANYFNVALADLTVLSQDLFLMAANHVRRQAEMSHDFEFSRRLVTVSVDGVTGGTFVNAVVYGTSTGVNVKTVIEVGQFDEDANLRPAQWTTVAEGLEQQREANRRTVPRYPTDGWFSSTPLGMSRFEVAGPNIYRWPKDADNDFTIGAEVYTFRSDWATADLVTPSLTVTGSGLSPDVTGIFPAVGVLNLKPLYLKNSTNLSGDSFAIWWSSGDSKWYITGGQYIGFTPISGFQQNSVDTATGAGTYTTVGATTGAPTATVNTFTADEWLEEGAAYMLWGIIVHLNYKFKEFVPRTEGNLPPPTQLRDEALQNFKDWDVFQYEQFRRHGR